jgi:hypothetical protein
MTVTKPLCINLKLKWLKIEKRRNVFSLKSD